MKLSEKQMKSLKNKRNLKIKWFLYGLLLGLSFSALVLENIVPEVKIKIVEKPVLKESSITEVTLISRVRLAPKIQEMIKKEGNYLVVLSNWNIETMRLYLKDIPIVTADEFQFLLSSGEKETFGIQEINLKK